MMHWGFILPFYRNSFTHKQCAPFLFRSPNYDNIFAKIRSIGCSRCYLLNTRKMLYAQANYAMLFARINFAYMELIVFGPCCSENTRRFGYLRCDIERSNVI